MADSSINDHHTDMMQGARVGGTVGMSLFGIYLREGVIYSILRTIVTGLEPPLANKLLDMFGVNHGAERLWPLP